MEPKIKLAAALLLIGMVILLAAPAFAQGRSMVAWWALTGGGGLLESGRYSLNGSLGQTAAGMVGEAHQELCDGVWCYTLHWDRQFIPVVQSQHSASLPVLPQIFWEKE